MAGHLTGRDESPGQGHISQDWEAEWVNVAWTLGWEVIG